MLPILFQLFTLFIPSAVASWSTCGDWLFRNISRESCPQTRYHISPMVHYVVFAPCSTTKSVNARNARWWRGPREEPNVRQGASEKDPSIMARAGTLLWKFDGPDIHSRSRYADCSLSEPNASVNKWTAAHTPERSQTRLHNNFDFW